MEFIKELYFKIVALWNKSIWYRILGTLVVLGVMYAMGAFSVLLGLLIIIFGFILLIRKYAIKKKIKIKPMYVFLLGIVLLFTGSFGAAQTQTSQESRVKSEQQKKIAEKEAAEKEAAEKAAAEKEAAEKEAAEKEAAEKEAAEKEAAEKEAAEKEAAEKEAAEKEAAEKAAAEKAAAEKAAAEKAAAEKAAAEKAAAEQAAAEQAAAEQAAAEQAAAGTTTTEGKIVGNVNSKIYHLPGQRNYKMNPENAVYFDTEQDAINAGYRKSKK